MRETRPNATVTTLLEMYNHANPSNGKTEEEKAERDANYKPGDTVIPKLSRREQSGDEDDRRMLEEIRELSLREVGVSGPRMYERGTRHRNRSHDSREDETRQRRRREGERSRRPGGQASTDSRSQARRIEHQSSLRSLISSSDVDSGEMEEEILRQIEDEGLLDGIDLDNMGGTQEDELSERIAEAYRRRHGQVSRSQETRVEDANSIRSRAMRPVDNRRTRRQHGRTTSAADEVNHVSHPPISRPRLLEAYPTGPGPRHRTSSESRRQTSPTPRPPPVHHQAARSATDLSNRPQAFQVRQRRPSDLSVQGRRFTGLQSGVPGDDITRSQARPTSSSSSMTTQDRGHASSQKSSIPTRVIEPDISPQNINSTPQISSEGTSDDLSGPPRTLDIHTLRSAIPSSSATSTERTRPILYPEPSIACERCGKLDIQHELHENCSACLDGKYSLCHRCYRLGLGCLHWYGFGQAAWHRFQLQGSTSQQLPHMLTSQQYMRPSQESMQSTTSSKRRIMTTEDPQKRLQSGAFCANCTDFANDCFWKCDYCNEGEWGFCNPCVNQGKCCTHPLLPVAHVSTTKFKGTDTINHQHSDSSFIPVTSPRLMQEFRSLDPASSGQYQPLTFRTNCNICTYPIQPSNTRFHCPQCDGGDYDICATCYLKLVASGRISKENGDKGWRRCLKGHRMVVVGFEDSVRGQKRVIVKDLVGGYALKDEASKAATASEEWSWRDGDERQVRTVSKQVAANHHGEDTSTVPLLQKYPPDGGIGMRVEALYSWWPQDGVKDELAFPKGAEIREVEDINGDWFWGCYAGAKGLFPGNYVRVLDMVSM